ncbi:hypothetical protein L9F63_018573, partial [Diploptera punctata]
YITKQQLYTIRHIFVIIMTSEQYYAKFVTEIKQHQLETFINIIRKQSNELKPASLQIYLPLHFIERDTMGLQSKLYCSRKISTIITKVANSRRKKKKKHHMLQGRIYSLFQAYSILCFIFCVLRSLESEFELNFYFEIKEENHFYIASCRHSPERRIHLS